MWDGTVSVSSLAAVALNSGNSLATTVVTVQNDPTNTDDIYVGNATSQSVRLVPGASEDYRASSVGQVYVIALSGTQRVNWHATRQGGG